MASAFSALFPYNKRDMQLSNSRPNKVGTFIYTSCSGIPKINICQEFGNLSIKY
jgi:hypothetical protein